MGTVIRAEGISYTYDDGTKALQDISFAVQDGEKVAFLGANGSGKSTLFLCINGILQPQAGRLYFQDIPYSYNRKGLFELRSQIGIVFQQPDNQLFSANVYQEISFGPMNLGLSEGEVRQRVEGIIAQLGMESFQEKPVHLLSGGQKKLVAIADILVMKPKVILFDEPASALDPKHTGIVREIIESLSRQGVTILLSTHDMDYALEWADKVFIFSQGRLLLNGSPETVFLDKAQLIQANLSQPKVLEVYHHLCAKGVLKEGLPIPRNWEQLKSYL